MPPVNGCLATMRSFTGGPLAREDELAAPHEVDALYAGSFFPPDVVQWMRTLPFWYEDEHAIYVHAGLDGEGSEWKHPRDGREKHLLWMRENDFFTQYKGKRLVFGHTMVSELPTNHLGRVAKWLDDPGDVWVRGDLIGLDTGCGKGGFLSAIELPRGKVYESR